MNYHCDDGNAEVEYEADTPREAAQMYVDDGDWGVIEETTWIDVWVWTEDEDDRQRVAIVIYPEEPECADGGYDHDWQSPEWLGGCRENPGVWGHGGGVSCHEVCANCGAYKVTDTWAQRPDTGEQGLRSVEYEEPDEQSLAWVEGDDE